MEKDDDIVVFAKYDSPVDANIVKGVLESNGVIAGVMGDSTANALMQGFPQGTIRVVVFRKDLQRALEIMDSKPFENPDMEADMEE
ncbi:MAG: DUF2007 domain-containing protein [Muribaculaceae bacterium]|nr:DUF2007 domain-containing protein [Muribaculaceae bacterium]MBR5639354.1 DUF2007 domain-containing protein [Muribaculaceae bacterium]